MLDQLRWNKLLESLAGSAPEDHFFRRIMEAYSEPHRQYHNHAHIEHCLRELDAVREKCEEPDEVEFAIWLHDVVYDPHSSVNEEKSVLLAKEILSELGCPESRSERIGKLILVTKHIEEPATADERLIVDIDLSILGQPPDIYERYEKNILAEYSWVPKTAYIEGRSHILRAFLNRPSIYYTDRFERLYGDQARENLADALISLAHLGL